VFEGDFANNNNNLVYLIICNIMMGFYKGV
jgi:hypothetical protein